MTDGQRLEIARFRFFLRAAVQKALQNKSRKKVR